MISQLELLPTAPSLPTAPAPIARPASWNHQPLVVTCGVGRDSVAVLVGLHQRGIFPDIIIFSDLGGEREETYAYIANLNEWLAKVGFPQLTIIKYKVRDYKHWPPYFTLEENCLTNCTLPGITLGPASCSGKWKAQAMHTWLREHWDMGIKHWGVPLKGKGCRNKPKGKVTKIIGFEDSPHEHGRAKGCNTFAVKNGELKWYDIRFPLQEWGWDLDRCIEEIKGAGLPVPVKSSCFFCLAMKPWEVDTLSENHLQRIVIMEARSKPHFVEGARKRGWRDKKEGKLFIEGLWRRAIKGCRGAIAKPGSMTEYIRQKELLPSAEIDRLIAATPTEKLGKADFTKLGFHSWQDWIASITNPLPVN